MGTSVWNGWEYAWWLVLIFQVFSHGLFFIFPKHVVQRFAAVPAVKNYNLAAGITFYAFLLLLSFSRIYFDVYSLMLSEMLYFVMLMLFVASIFFFAINEIHLPASTGLYRISRHPVYVSTYGVMLSGILITRNWYLLLLWLLYIYLNHFIVLAEEQHLLKQFGKDYKEYMDRTPRYFVW